MTYEIIYDRKPLEFLESLPKELRKRIFNKAADAKENPLHFFEQLEGRKDFKLRVGDYRFFYIIDFEKKEVKVTEFLTAEQAHKKYGMV